MDRGFTSGWFKRILAASYSADLAKFEDITAGFFTQAAIWQPGPERRLLEKMIGQIKLALAIQRDENGLLSVALDQISERLAEIEDKSWAAKLERA
ncbi:MAG: hypothetical protein KF826_03820 [Xanthobacteraceae bacterium]|nr:hypothetical protein [Xanthobacteraceae bacterium]MCW5676396.1 hypothetical protein [Xanthobacteraceae bacterium]